MGKRNGAELPTTDGVNAFIGKRTVFKGKMSFQGMFRVDGKYEGEIISGDSLVVGETAEISARIHVNTLTVHGNVNGNVIAKKRILIYPPGRILGDIQTPVLAVSEGAIFEGKCRMTKPGQGLEQKAAPPEARGEKTNTPESEKPGK